MSHRCAHFIPVCLVCAATIGAHFVVARKLASQRDQFVVASQAFQRPADDETRAAFDGTDFDGMICIDPPSPDEVMMALPDEALGSRAAPRLLATLGYETPAADEDGPADAAQPGEAVQPQSRPLSRHQRDEQMAVRAVIDEELSEASAEERDIWFEELKSLPAEVVRDLLQVRQQMRVLSPNHPLSRPSPLAAGEGHRPREIVAEPVTRSRPDFDSDWQLSREELLAAIDWATHNIANADTYGYKRIEPLLVDVHGAAYTVELATERTIINGGGCRLATSRIDPRQGELVETGRPLDLAIDGPGFFSLGNGDNDMSRLTRRGVFVLDAERRLQVAIENEKEILLQPVIVIPAEMESLEVAGDGTVTVKARGAETAKVVGRIQIVMLEDAAQLSSYWQGLYQALQTNPPARRIVNPGEGGAGVIRQGYLEASNVDLERERTARDKWEAMLKLLPIQDVPRTATQPDRMPQ